MATTISYTIQSGDTLSSIAAAKLGDSSRWTEIHNLNKAIIPNANIITAGMVIQLPHSAAQSIANVPVVKPTNFLMYGVAAVMGLSLLPLLFMGKKKKSQPAAASTQAPA